MDVFIQFSTLLILAFAANTSFAGFPRLAAILARDGFLPRQLTGLRDRLVFSNGIIALTLATAGIIVLFGGNSHSLIPLFAIGVFMAFTFLVSPLLDYLDQTDQEHNDGQLATVIIPEFVPAKWWQGLLHNPTAWMLKAALLYRRRRLGYQRAIIDIPFHLKK